MKYSKTITYTNKRGRTISYTRTIHRKYGQHIKIVRNKKTGKSYAYREYKVQGKTIRRRIRNVMRNGKLTEYGKEWLAEYKKGLDFSDRNDLEARIWDYQKRGETLTTEKLRSIMEDSKIGRYIYNMGGDPDELAEQLGVDVNAIYSRENWDFERNEPTFTFNGMTYVFTFDYDSHSMMWKVL